MRLHFYDCSGCGSDFSLTERNKEELVAIAFDRLNIKTEVPVANIFDYKKILNIILSRELFKIE